MSSRSMWLALTLLAAATPSLAAQYTLTADPSYTAKDAQAIYAPLVTELNAATGDTFTLVTSPNYHAFWQDLRKQEMGDFAFVEPHFADYLIQRGGFAPLVATVEPLQYLVVADKTQAAQGDRGLVGKKIGSMSSPSMGYAVLAQLYSDPVGQPDIWSVATSWTDSLNLLRTKQVAAAVVPTYVLGNRQDIGVLHQGEALPGRALVAANKVPEAAKKRVTDAMLALGKSKDPAVIEALTKLGTKGFVPTTAQAYKGEEVALRFFFGYKPLPGAVLPPLVTPIPEFTTLDEPFDVPGSVISN